ncbi:MAG TPA: hypothetical protein DCL07_05535, partial [Cryomorphaceae bacterium]|nr:hypothetical protein [Cryomorphaceae bacterium]
MPMKTTQTLRGAFALILGMLCLESAAQIASTNLLSRGSVTELQRDSAIFWLYNPTAASYTIEAVRTAGFFGDTLL